MKSYIQIRDRAIFLRKNGASYGEIRRETGVSLSIISKWLKKIPLSTSQKVELDERVKQKIARGRLNAKVSKRVKRVYREKVIYEEAEREFEKLLMEPAFLVGLTLYLAKGTRRGGQLRFMSSDVDIVNIMKKWFKVYLNSDVKTVVTGEYKTLYVTGINSFRRVVAWQKLLIQYYNNVLKNQ